MAGFAAARLTRAGLQHALAELAAMWVLVTRRAGAILKAKARHFFLGEIVQRLVTVSAGDSHVAASQWEALGLVPLQGKG